MKIACLSDLHWNLPKLPPVDLVLIAGDLSYARYKDLFSESKWLFTHFKEWLNAHSLPTIIVGGNHDFYMQKNISELRRMLPCEILENSATEFNGVKIFGTPYTLEFCEWAYQATEPSHHTQSDDLENLERVFNLPECKEADIIISHGPPLDILDRSDSGDRCGSYSLQQTIVHNKPSLVICGHIHEGYGIYEENGTVILNCAYVITQGNRYVPRNEVIVVDFDEGKKIVRGLKYAQNRR